MSLQEVPSTATLLPLEFTPLLKRTRWGGERLGTQLQKLIGVEGDFGESWELSDHPQAPTLIAGGEYADCTLTQLIQKNPNALFGTGAFSAIFPLLIKFIDATDRLSLQVHPGEPHLRIFDAARSGKSEAWVILDAVEGSCIFAGLKSGVDETQLRQHLEQGTIEECLHSYPVTRGDCVFIPAGTLHAIGEGILLVEVQQTSDLTFRLYDWNRLDQSGNPRPLHIAKAFDCIDFKRGPVELLQPQMLSSGKHQVELLLESEYFSIRRHRSKKSIPLASPNQAQILIILEGTGQLDCGGEIFELLEGKTILIPATSSDCQIHVDGEIEFLEVRPS
ncbi:MAG: AraC family ligand binding domain-containing protein [Gimesia sp.]